MPISIRSVLIRSSHDLLRFSLQRQAPETLIRKQKGKCNSKQYSLLLFSFFFFSVLLCFGLRTGEPGAETVMQGTPEQECSRSSLHCSTLFALTSMQKIYVRPGHKRPSQTLITIAICPEQYLLQSASAGMCYLDFKVGPTT